MDFLANKIFRYLENLVSLDQNFNTLKRKLKDLKAVKEDNESKKSVELQPRKKLKKEVEIWLQNVGRLNGEILDLEKKVKGRNLLSRGLVGENVLKRIPEVEELLQQGKSFTSLVIDDPQWVGQVLSTTNLVGKGPENVMKEIWEYLMDGGVSKIGVWGMGGTGKTTIMKHINNQLVKEKEKFQCVYWVTVSKESNIAKLQNDIAGAMNESLTEDDKTRRAGELHDKLAKKRKYVLILDDLWDKLSLDDVGIPEPSNGSKLLVTTRLLEVCTNLGCRQITVPPLSKQDAWNLFLQKVGEDVLNYPDLLPIVKSVAEECGGLPLAVVTIASSMKGVRHICEWRNALRDLSRQVESVNGMEEKVFQRLQFSYDRLKDEKLKHCFLFCAIYPEDFQIDISILIEFWIVEGFVEEMESKQAEIDKGHAVLNQLKNCCLLVDGYRYGCVQMHDVMRDMALRITKVKPRFLVRAGMQLSEIPDVQEWNEDLEVVSLFENLNLLIPSQMPPPKCPKLKSLFLCNCNIKSIPEGFFEQMHGLKILDLYYNPIESLPESISNLETLTTLLLNSCYNLKKVPSFSKLQALKKLDLAYTEINDLPHGMERLVNLKYLDLRGTSITEIADGIVAKYTSLQYLAVTDSPRKVSRFMRGEEIGGLRKLEFFEGNFYDWNEWNSYIQALHAPIETPRHYSISVGHEEVIIYGEVQKFIGLNGCGIICTDGFKVLSDVKHLSIVRCVVDLCEDEAFFSRCNLVPHNIFSSLSRIYINSCKNIKKLFSSNWVLQKNLQNLNDLIVVNCEDMEEIITSESRSEEEGISAIKLSLPNLKALQLQGLPELKSICSEVMVCDSIESIYITNCPKLKRIPLNLPLHDDGQPYPPHSLREIVVDPKEWWELLEWDQPNAKFLLEPRVHVDFGQIPDLRNSSLDHWSLSP